MLTETVGSKLFFCKPASNFKCILSINTIIYRYFVIDLQIRNINIIISFSLENFGSIKEKQTLSFEADKSDHLEDYYIINSAGFRLLKLGLIYGANASGKTTILNGLEFLRDIILEPEEKKTDSLNFEPFLFDEETINKTSKLNIDFIQNEIRYDYEVEFTKTAIVSERLDNYNPNKANVFYRTTDLKQISPKLNWKQN